MVNDDKESEVQPDISPSQVTPQKAVVVQPSSTEDLRKLTFQCMHDGFSIVDASGVHIDVNPAFCAMTGFSESELIGLGPEHSYWPPEELENIQRLLARAMHGEFAEIELTFMRKGGERFQVVLNPFAIRDGKGTITFFATTVRDISQSLQMQSTLRDSEQRYRGLFENAADAIVILQGEKIIDFNQRALEMFGVASIEQMTSRASFDFFPPLQPNGEDSRKFSIEKLKAAREGKPQFFAWHHVKLDGTPFDAEVSLSTFQLGESMFIQAIIRDITRRKKMEKALKESERRYRRLFESAGDGMLIMQGEQVLDCNERVLELYGVSRDQLMSLSTYALSPPTQLNGQGSPEFFAEKIAALQTENPQIFEWSGNKLDGTPIETEVTLTTFTNDGALCTQSMIRDITERKRMQNALKESEQRYRGLFENAGDAVMILKDNQVIDCNDRALQLTGHSRDAILSTPTIDFFPPTQPNGQGSLPLFIEKVEASHSGVPQVFEWTGSVLDGRTVNTEVTLTTFTFGGQHYVQSLIRDISERKQLEQSLTDSELRFRTLFENAGDAISILKDFRTIDCNRQLCELYGLSHEEIISASAGQYFPSTQPNGQDSREFFYEKVLASRSGKTQVYEWQGQKPDGTPVISEITLTSLVLGGETYEQATARDITRRKQLESSLLELNKNLEDRVLQRTEELEKAYAQLLQRNSQYRALAKRLTAAEEEERKRIARLLHDNHQQLLVAAKFKAEMLASHLYGADVNAAGAQILEILDQALDVTRSLTMELAPPILYGAGFVAAMQWLAAWMEEHHHLQVLVTGSLPVTPLPVDVSSLLFRTVRELLFNVIKHSGVTQASVKIVAFDQGLRVTVSDEGGGFDVADALHATRSYGLFSIQEQLASLDGRLDISSAPQRGTVCTVSIPVAIEEDAHPDAVAALATTLQAPDTPHALRSPIRILVADDHALARDALVQILGLIDDFEVVGEAVDGIDAVEKAWVMQPDVVLMDATMPRLSGLDATRRITTEIPGIKVIGLSMNARADMEPQMIAAGAASYLQKLTPVDELFSAIRGVMNRDTTEAR